jgi:hypothetical protein
MGHKFYQKYPHKKQVERGLTPGRGDNGTVKVDIGGYSHMSCNASSHEQMEEAPLERVWPD